MMNTDGSNRINKENNRLHCVCIYMLAKSQVAAQQENYVGTTFIPQNCIGWSMAFEIMLRNEWIKMASLASECTFYEFLCRANNFCHTAYSL